MEGTASTCLTVTLSKPSTASTGLMVKLSTHFPTGLMVGTGLTVRLPSHLSNGKTLQALGLVSTKLSSNGTKLTRCRGRKDKLVTCADVRFVLCGEDGAGPGAVHLCFVLCGEDGAGPGAVGQHGARSCSAWG